MKPSSNKTTNLCSICKKAVSKKENRYFPFCSERCRLVDLSQWLGQGYSIKGESANPEVDDFEEGS